MSVGTPAATVGTTSVRLLVVATALLLGGCGALIDRATTSFASDLEQAVVN